MINGLKQGGVKRHIHAARLACFNDDWYPDQHRPVAASTRPVPDQCQTSICRYAVAGLILLASHSGADHAGDMFRLSLRILAIACAGMTSLVIWQDLSAPSDASQPFGRIWHDLHSGSLQVSEAVVSRFIDPCGLIIALDCTPFLWHPLIASFLGWPAGLIGCALCGVLWFFGRPKQRHGRPSKRALSR